MNHVVRCRVCTYEGPRDAAQRGVVARHQGIEGRFVSGAQPFDKRVVLFHRAADRSAPVLRAGRSREPHQAGR